MKPKDNFYCIHKEFCEEAASAIHAAFTWNETSEGFAYWQQIYLRLMEISRKRIKKRIKK